LQCVAVCCSVLQCVAVCCSVLQCVAVCCSVMHCVAVRCSVLQCVAVLQCTAVCCNCSCTALKRKQDSFKSCALSRLARIRMQRVVVCCSCSCSCSVLQRKQPPKLCASLLLDRILVSVCWILLHFFVACYCTLLCLAVALAMRCSVDEKARHLQI